MKYVSFRVKAVLDCTWSSWFENVEMEHLENGDTLLHGYVEDMAAFYGILALIENLGVELISLKYH